MRVLAEACRRDRAESEMPMPSSLSFLVCAIADEFDFGDAGVGPAHRQAAFGQQIHRARDRKADDTGGFVDPAVAVELGFLPGAKALQVNARFDLQLRLRKTETLVGNGRFGDKTAELPVFALG